MLKRQIYFSVCNLVKVLFFKETLAFVEQNQNGGNCSVHLMLMAIGKSVLKTDILCFSLSSVLLTVRTRDLSTTQTSCFSQLTLPASYSFYGRESSIY
jgi:hypothetical protein